MKTFNKKGDEGTTSLLFGKRVPKSDLRCEAYGTVDEAISSLGVARNLAKKDRTKEIILQVQRELFDINAELATEAADRARLAASFKTVTDEMTGSLETLIDELEAGVAMPKAFVIPGANLAAALLDVSRAIVRRAERRVVALRESGDVENAAVMHYLNRLADLLFVLARYEET